MGIKASDDLFQLIRSLNPTEKRAFRLISERHSRHEGNNYLLLFDAIAAQSTFDEAAIRQQFKGKTFLKNLSEAKSYLYRTLLRSLRFSKGTSSSESELREMLDHLEILHARGLHDQAERQVKVGLERARILNLHVFIAEFLRWQRRLTKIRGGKDLNFQLRVIGSEESQALAHLRTEAHLRDLMGRIQSLIAQNVDLRNPAQADELDAIWAAPELRQPPVEAGFHALSAYYYSNAYYFRLKGQQLESMDGWEKLVATFEAFPIQIKQQTDQYLNSLSALLDARINNRQFKPFLLELAKLKAQHSSNPSRQARMFLLGHHHTLRYALTTGQFETALHGAQELEEGMVKHQKFMSASLEMTLFYNLCTLFFNAERYPEAQKYINLALNRPQLPIRKDLVDALRLLEIVGRYTRSQTDLLEHLLKAQERRLRQTVPKPVFLSLVVHTFIKLIGARNAKETKTMLNELLVELSSLPLELRVAGHEEILWWTKSRVEGKSIALLLQQNAKTEGV